VLVTFRRPESLKATLDWLARQTERVELLVVVDNEPSARNEAAVSTYASGGHLVEYVPAPENLGPAGGRALGMRHILEVASDDDWMVMLDDDLRPYPESTLANLRSLARRMLAQDPRAGAVGLRGVRFDWKRARLVPVPESELSGPVEVDCHPTGHVPMYLVKVVREVGTFHAPLFIGLTELEYGIRLRQAGYSLYADAVTTGQSRAIRLGVYGPSIRVGEPNWRRYYALRNLIYILRLHGSRSAAVRVTLVRGLAKPIINMVVRPRLGTRHLTLNVRACRDGWLGRMGRTVEPGARRPNERVPRTADTEMLRHARATAGDGDSP
jgi:glycosyltransferase involved in cell wall biosynthesis